MRNMKPRTVTAYFLTLCILLIPFCFTGCITQRVAQEDSLVGALLRQDSNNCLPPDIQRNVVERQNQYDDINDINFVVMREKCRIDKDEFENLLLLRWHLLRENRRNDILLTNTKILMQQMQKCEIDFYEGRKKLISNYDSLREMHKKFMDQAQILLDGTRPYKQSIIYKFTQPWY